MVSGDRGLSLQDNADAFAGIGLVQRGDAFCAHFLAQAVEVVCVLHFHIGNAVSDFRIHQYKWSSYISFVKSWVSLLRIAERERFPC